MSPSSEWYSRIPAHDRQVVDAVAKWLSPVPWQWFVTLTFPWNVRSETADRKIKKWLDTTERELRARVCFVAGKERKPTSHGMTVPWHFHLLITSNVAIPEDRLKENWIALTGHGVRRSDESDDERDDESGYVDDCVVVKSYQHNHGGPEYCLKSISTCDGDWFFRWLELFNPLMKQTRSPNHDKIRQRSRFAKQLDEKH